MVHKSKTHGHRTTQNRPGTCSLRKTSAWKTSLYQLVKNHIETFYAQVETETEYGLPAYVKKEFDAFLDCGILSNVFYSCVVMIASMK